MAKFTPGPLAGAISGSIGGSTYSHNRFGPYIRRRAIPVTSTSPEAMNAKSRLSATSQAWQSLGAADKLAWKEWALVNTVTDSLGNQQALSAHQAFVGLNSRLACDGIAQIDVPPLIPTPPGLLTLAQDADIGLGDMDLTFTTTPLGAGLKLWIQAAVCDSEGINYVRNLLRFIGTSAAAQATPFDHQSLVEARFGTLQVGQFVHVWVSVFDTATGQLSQPMSDVTAVTST